MGHSIYVYIYIYIYIYIYTDINIHEYVYQIVSLRHIIFVVLFNYASQELRLCSVEYNYK
jgi:hypothetical protein